MVDRINLSIDIKIQMNRHKVKYRRSVDLNDLFSKILAIDFIDFWTELEIVLFWFLLYGLTLKKYTYMNVIEINY